MYTADSAHTTSDRVNTGLALLLTTVRGTLHLALLICRPVAVLASILACLGVLMCLGYWALKVPNIRLLPVVLTTAAFWLFAVLYETALYMTETETPKT